MEGKEKLNILILSWRGPDHPHAGGAEESTHEHAKGWVKAGHKVTLFTSYFRGGKKEEVIDGVQIIRRGLQIFGVQWEAFKWYLLTPHSKYNLVIDQFHGIPFFTPLFVRVKKLAFIHEVTKEVWALNPWPKPFNLLPAIVGTIAEPLIFKLFYKKTPFMTVSNSTKEDLTSWGIPAANITVVHNGLTVPKLKKKLPKEIKKTAIFLGALSKDKGIEDAIKIFAAVDRGDPTWQFWVVGKGEEHYLKFLKSLCVKLGIYKKVKFWGYVSNEKKFELLERAHVLINPSVREGWGFVVMEAASCGTPTVGYNVAGLKDSILDGKTGILCDLKPYACAQEILSLMSDQTKYNRLRQNCFKWASEFSWEKSVKKSLTLIENISKA